MPFRPLTKGEVALTLSIFGNAIDCSTVQISSQKHNALFHGKNITMAPDGNIYCNQTYKEDYSTCDVGFRSHFVHEMVHVWQYQNKVLHPVLAAAKDTLKHKFNYSAAYKYSLSQNKDLCDYGIEQQACIIQDYYLLCQGYLPQRHTPSKMPANDNNLKTQYKAVLKNFLNQPSYARPKKVSFASKALWKTTDQMTRMLRSKRKP